jgi:hypothetical protein
MRAGGHSANDLTAGSSPVAKRSQKRPPSPPTGTVAVSVFQSGGSDSPGNDSVQMKSWGAKSAGGAAVSAADRQRYAMMAAAFLLFMVVLVGWTSSSSAAASGLAVRRARA